MSALSLTKLNPRALPRTPVSRVLRRPTISRPKRDIARRALSFEPTVIAQVAEEAERAGTVDAPIGYAVGIAIVVALVATAIVPIALRPGEEAASKIFEKKDASPLDKKE